jgi:hypothetical protein
MFLPGPMELLVIAAILFVLVGIPVLAVIGVLLLFYRGRSPGRDDRPVPEARPDDGFDTQAGAGSEG